MTDKDGIFGSGTFDNARFDSDSELLRDQVDAVNANENHTIKIDQAKGSSSVGGMFSGVIL